MSQRIDQTNLDSVLFRAPDITTKVGRLARQISDDYVDSEKPPVLICVLRGAAVFCSELMLKMTIHMELDFLEATSMDGTKSTGTVRIDRDIKTDIRGRDIIIVEDIVDTGLTLSALQVYLQTKGPKSIRICVLLDKTEARKTKVRVDYCGFKVPTKFVVGYGLDFDELYRNLPFIGVLRESIYTGV